MRIPRMKPVWVALTGCWFIIGQQWVPGSWPWRAGSAVVLGVFVVWSIYSVVSESPEEKRDRELAAIRAKTAELEADLGYEPLNLHELDDVLKEDRKVREGE